MLKPRLADALAAIGLSMPAGLRNARLRGTERQAHRPEEAGQKQAPCANAFLHD